MNIGRNGEKMIKNIKSAIVIGATGLVGRSLVNHLNQLVDCERIVVVVRKHDEQFEQFTKVDQLVIDDFLMLNDEDASGFSHAFSCLGSTIKKAGSKENFYNIDFEINAHFADLLVNTDTFFAIVSAEGANERSPFFYNQVKGKLENYLKSLSLYQLAIIRPSLLIGERAETRTLEDISQSIFKRVSQFLPNTFKYKPVTAEQVANTMVVSARTQNEKIKIYDNLEIQKHN